MSRRKLTEEEKQRKELIKELLKKINITTMEDVNSIMREMMSDILSGCLEGELESELGYSKYDYKNKGKDNSRNGYSKKIMKTSSGDMEIEIPRDRNGEFEPQIIKKRQTMLGQDLEEKIISMYAKGMSTSDMEEHLRETYGTKISDTTISRITDKILPIAKSWQNRPLEKIYSVVFLDAIHFHVRSEGHTIKKAVYIAIGINLDGLKEVLGMWIGENESAKFWATILNELKIRGVDDILIACVGGLTGFAKQ